MYHFKKIDENSYIQLQILHQKSFGSLHPLSFYNIKYDTSIFGLKNVGFIAETDNGEPAAFYGVFPIILKYNSKDYLVAQSGDTMTAPEHRKKGLFVKLAKETYNYAKERNVKLIYGFPNKFSYPGFQRKLDWVFAGNMQKFTIQNLTIPLCEMAYKWKFLKTPYDKFVRRQLAKYQIENNDETIAIFNVKTAHGYIKKDTSYFHYKLTNQDNYLIKINGFTLLIKLNGHLIIGAIGYFEKNKTGIFLKTIKKLKKKIAARKAIITISKNYWLYDYLSEIFVPEESLPIGFYKYNDLININDIEFTGADYDTF